MLKVIALAAILALASSALGGQLAGPVAAAVICVTVQPPVGTPFVDCSQGQVLNILPAGNNGLTVLRSPLVVGRSRYHPFLAPTPAKATALDDVLRVKSPAASGAPVAVIVCWTRSL